MRHTPDVIYTPLTPFGPCQDTASRRGRLVNPAWVSNSDKRKHSSGAIIYIYIYIYIYI